MHNHMNLNLLRTLHILLEECHVSKAAARLHITQSAVSRQLAQLRELCDDPLLVREGNQLVATPRALFLKQKVEVLLNDFERLIIDEKSFQPKDWEYELILASSDYVAQYVLPEIAAHLHPLAPKLGINYYLWQPEYIERLHEMKIDLATSMLVKKPEGVSSLKLGEDTSVCLMEASHPLSNAEKITIDDFLAYPHIKVTGGADKDSATDKVLKKMSLNRRFSLKVPFFSAAMNRLVLSEDLMVVPTHVAKSLARHWTITYQELPFDLPINQYWLIWHPKYDNDVAHQWMRAEIYSVIQDSDYSMKTIEQIDS